MPRSRQRFWRHNEQRHLPVPTPTFTPESSATQIPTATPISAATFEQTPFPTHNSTPETEKLSPKGSFHGPEDEDLIPDENGFTEIGTAVDLTDFVFEIKLTIPENKADTVRLESFEYGWLCFRAGNLSRPRWSARKIDPLRGLHDLVSGQKMRFEHDKFTEATHEGQESVEAVHA